MALDKQVHIYSIDTSAFYNENEEKIHKRLNRMYLFRSTLKKRKDKNSIDEKMLEKIEKYLTNTNRRIRNLKNKLLNKLKTNSNIRFLNKNHLNDRNVISIFESELTRTIGIPTDTLSIDIIVVRTFYFDVLKDIMTNGFILENEKYVFFTSSAGQIRTKKSVFIKENILKKHQKRLMCGLTIDKINEFGGINVNKYLSYLALCNSATDVWDDFNIDKAIVVDDFETTVNGLVDFINDKNYSITRKNMDISIEHTDGCGMILPKKSKKNMIIRLPWVKGLLSPFSFDKFIHIANKNDNKKYSGKIKDIYGKEWDLIKDDIEIIFVKSQFKMWKYYPNQVDENENIIKYGWDIYKENFKKYNCQAGKCNEEEDIFKNAKIAYQMLQTLTNITDKELNKLCSQTKEDIINIGHNRKIMLKVLGINKSTRKNYLQQAIELYPQLLSDVYTKEILKQVKKSLVNNARCAKFDIGGKYTYIIPDLYAFCEYLILGNKNPKGLLKNGEVYCNLYRDIEKLNCLRSPHLYREHAIRKNTIDDKKDEWFITNGLYTSCHDLISKILQFDTDGDQSLVIADDLFVNIAERHMQDVVPLYYKMATAKAEKITAKSLYNGLILAYTGGNIGVVSNNITKIWNSDNIDLDMIKLLCMENNFVIDYAKTLYKPKRPDYINKRINSYVSDKLPHFFIYAKNKTKKQVKKTNNSVVNRLEKIIPNSKIDFKTIGLQDFDYKMIMKNKDVDINTDNAKIIINKYKNLDLKKYFIINRKEIGDDNDKVGNLVYLYKKIREKLLLLSSDDNYIVDVLVKYLYKYKNSKFKTTLWECFGDIIVANIKDNINQKLSKGYIHCIGCNKLILPTNNRQKYCSTCWKEKERELWRENKRKIRNVQV